MPGTPEETSGKPAGNRSGRGSDGTVDGTAGETADGPLDDPSDELLDPAVDVSARRRLEREIGILPWSELARHFARGVVVVVDPGIALVDVALGFSEDDAVRVGAWLECGQVVRASDDDARGWVEHRPDFRCVVVAPWVLVQVREPGYGADAG